MGKFEDFLVTKQFKNIMAKLYGLGAAVVIAGALFKIQHWPGASPMLIVGMGTEVLIFIVSAFEPIHMDLDWSLVYPELAGMHDDDHGKKKEDKKSVTETLDSMLEKAKIGPELIESLGSGLKSLSEQATKMTNLTDATVATNEFTTNVKSASQKIGGLSDAYDRASSSIGNSISDLEKASSKTSQALDLISNSTSQQAGSYAESLGSFSKNLGALNSAYELQAQAVIKATKMYEGVERSIASLGESANDANKFKQQMSALTDNLASLNTIYGNMLSAMNFKK
jgi:gliding motility-associated protein GldL